MLESVLDGLRRGNVAFELAVGDVDVLEVDLMFWIVQSYLCIGASEAAVGTHFAIVLKENEV